MQLAHLPVGHLSLRSVPICNRITSVGYHSTRLLQRYGRGYLGTECVEVLRT